MPMNAIRLANWHFNTYPTSGPMSRAERALWLEMVVMRGAFLPTGPKEMRRIAYGAAGEPEREERSGTLISKLVDR